MISVETILPDEWRRTCELALEEGRFLGLYAVEGPCVRALFSAPGGMRVLRCASAAPTIVDLAPAAGWDEREAHDLYGAAFAGHEPLRPLLAHPSELETWTVPVRGEYSYQVAVGPIHAGVIESGHFRFHVVGERILHVDLRLFYKHRGLERAAEGSSPALALPYVGRACAACAVANSIAYAQACEAARGLSADAELARARTILLELERVYNHLHDVGAICGGVGFAAGSMLFASLKERAQRLNLRLTGHRFLFGRVAVGTSAFALHAVEADRLREELADLRDTATRGWREPRFNDSVQDRLHGIGSLSSAEAQRLGTVGPAARASGVQHDVRTESPELAYAGFTAAAPREPEGDIAARIEMRAVELDVSLELLDDLLARPLAGGGTIGGAVPAEIGVGRVESPRGETVCAVELRGDAVTRVHLRTGSYANWPSVAQAAAGQLLPDFPLVNKSFELCYACADR